MMKDILVKTLFSLFLCAIIGSCAEPDYCVIPADSSPLAPHIESVNQLAGEQKAEFEGLSSSGDDPWLVIMNLAFSDSNGDLANGKLAIFLEKKEVNRLNMNELFKERALDAGATSGEVPILLRIVPSGEIVDGALMRVGLALIDEAGLVSNCSSLNIIINKESM